MRHVRARRHSYRMYDRPTMKGRLEIDESTFAEPRLQPVMSFVDRSSRGSRLIRGVATLFTVVPPTSSSNFRLGLHWSPSRVSRYLLIHHLQSDEQISLFIPPHLSTSMILFQHELRISCTSPDDCL